MLYCCVAISRQSSSSIVFNFLFILTVAIGLNHPTSQNSEPFYGIGFTTCGYNSSLPSEDNELSLEEYGRHYKRVCGNATDIVSDTSDDLFFLNGEQILSGKSVVCVCGKVDVQLVPVLNPVSVCQCGLLSSGDQSSNRITNPGG